nr:ankyrin repeat domain-containing protein SOWAHB isoform X3 [Parasteatoda tepidariorum]
MADELTFTSECVAKYIIENGGRVTNHELVRHFKKFLNGPNSLPNARAVFKDYVNAVASIKTEDGVKYVVLKKRGHEEKVQNSSSFEGSEGSLNERKKCRLSEDPDCSSTKNSTPYVISHSSSSPSVLGTTTSMDPVTTPTSPILWSSDLPPGLVPQPPPRRKHSMKGKENRSNKFEASLKIINSEKENASGPTKDEIREICSPGSVKEKAHFLNKMASENDVSKLSISNRRRDRDDKGGEYDDMCSVSSLDPRRKEWILKSASSDYHELVRLLREEPKLVNVTDHHKYTALHYAAKHGKLDVIKLIAGTHKLDSNLRTGYTPLHLAAMFGHEEIMEVLINTYGADPSLRDYTGKRALHYLPKNQSERFITLFPSLAFPILLCGKIVAGKRDKEPNLVRMGSLNSKVKKGSVLSASGRAITRMKSWGSADNIQDRVVNLMPPPKTFPKKKKSRRDIIGISENWRGKSPDSDSDSATSVVP